MYFSKKKTNTYNSFISYININYLFYFLYSYDTRVPGPTAHWTDEAFADRAHWVGNPTSALQIKNVQAQDRATYRCRVDYTVSPTRNYRIALDVIGEYERVSISQIELPDISTKVYHDYVKARFELSPLDYATVSK